MVNLRPRSWLLVTLLCSIAAPASGQSSQFAAVKEAMLRIRELQREIDGGKARTALLPIARELTDCADKLQRNAPNLGRELRDAPGAYSSERARIHERSDLLVRGAQRLWRQANNWRATLEGEQDHADMTRESREEARQTIELWEGFVRETEDRRRWLATGLATAKELRENVARPGTVLQRAEDDLAVQHKEAGDRSRRAFDEYWSRKTAWYDAIEKQKQAHEVWLNTLQREGPSEFSKRMREAVNAWYECHERVLEASRREFEAFVQMERTIAEDRRIAERYLQQVIDLRKFLVEIKENGANTAWQEFSVWTQLFEREFGR